MENTKKDLVLLWNPESNASHGVKVAWVDLCYIEENRVKSFVWDSIYGPGEYADLRIRAQCDVDRGTPEERHLYGWSMEYYPYSVSLVRAESMVKTVKRIQRKLEEYRQEWGDVPTFESYAQRIGKAIGAKSLVHWIRRPGYGWEDHGDFVRTPMKDAAETLKWLINRELRPETAEVSRV